MSAAFLDDSEPKTESGRRGAARQIHAWWPVAIACVVILIESTRALGADNTSRWLRPAFELMFGRFSNAAWSQLHHLLRKTGHFIGYGTVCLTFLRAWLLTLDAHHAVSLRRLHWQATWRAILGAALVASCDEWHQSYLPNRTGTPWDVLLDTCGASVMCLVVWTAFGWFRALPARALDRQTVAR